MKRFFKSKQFKGFLCVIAALLLGAVIAAFTHINNTPLSSATSVIFKPVQSVSVFITNKLDSFDCYFRSSKALLDENNTLKKENSKYKKEVSDYDDAKAKLSLYEDFLGVKDENPDFKFVSAAVLNRDSADIYGSFTLNKGKIDGIAMNDPVIYGKNLVGLVTSLKPTSCTISTLSSPDVNVGAYESRTEESGYVCGFTAPQKKSVCKMPGLSRESKIAAGGIVCTSGIGGVFPKGLIVGTIAELNEDNTDISYYATIKSDVNFSKLSDVFVITDFDGQGVGKLGD